MSLVIAGGQSVNNYDRNDLKKAAKRNFTFCVNDAAFDFACDIIVACDPDWIKDNRSKLLKLGKPIITRKWDCLGGLGLDLIELPNDVVEFARLSGMVATKISDGFSKRLGMASFVLGVDHTPAHYYDKKGRADKMCDLKDYDALNCVCTINIGSTSAVTAWPKHHGLPELDKPDLQCRRWGTLFIRATANELMYEGVDR